MPNRSVEFDVLLAGNERMEQQLNSLGDAFDDLRKKVERLDGKTAQVKGIAKLEKDSDSLGDSVKALAAKVLTGGAAVVKFASYAGLAAGAVAPLAIGVGIATAAVAKFAVEASGATAAIAPLAAGALFLQLTFKGMAKEFEKSVEPITKGWEKQTAAAGKLATRGLKPLAKEFAKINLPVIAKAQDRIARSTDRVITGFGKWVNSAAGTKVIKTIVDDTAETFEKLAPSVSGVVQSFAMMAGRVSGVAFKEFGDGARIALDSLNGFLDRIDASDVTRGFDRIKDAANFVVDAFRKIRDAVKWVVESKDKILALSDAILVLTVAGAALTGAWPVAIGAALILLARHFDTVKDAAGRMRDRVQDLPKKFESFGTTLGAFGSAWDNVKEGWRDFTDRVGPKMGPLLEKAQTHFVKIQPLLSAIIELVGALGEAFLKAAGPIASLAIDGIGMLLDAFGNLAFGASMMAEKVLGAFTALLQPLVNVAKKLKLPFADSMQDIIDGANRAKSRINTSMSQVKTDLAQRQIRDLQATVNRLKGKTVKTDADKRAIADAQARIRTLQGSINNLRGKTVTVGIYYKPKNSPGAGFGGAGLMRARGGPVKAGRPYIVGEKRAELFVPKQSGMIKPRVPSGWNGGSGGGSQRVVLEIRSGGSKLDDAVVDIVRRAVKVKGGGNVQTALGRGR